MIDRIVTFLCFLFLFFGFIFYPVDKGWLNMNSSVVVVSDVFETSNFPDMGEMRDSFVENFNDWSDTLWYSLPFLFWLKIIYRSNYPLFETARYSAWIVFNFFVRIHVNLIFLIFNKFFAFFMIGVGVYLLFTIIYNEYTFEDILEVFFVDFLDLNLENLKVIFKKGFNIFLTLFFIAGIILT